MESHFVCVPGTFADDEVDPNFAASWWRNLLHVAATPSAANVHERLRQICEDEVGRASVPVFSDEVDDAPYMLLPAVAAAFVGGSVAALRCFEAQGMLLADGRAARARQMRQAECALHKTLRPLCSGCTHTAARRCCNGRPLVASSSSSPSSPPLPPLPEFLYSPCEECEALVLRRGVDLRAPMLARPEALLAQLRADPSVRFDLPLLRCPAVRAAAAPLVTGEMARAGAAADAVADWLFELYYGQGGAPMPDCAGWLRAAAAAGGAMPDAAALLARALAQRNLPLIRFARETLGAPLPARSLTVWRRELGGDMDCVAYVLSAPPPAPVRRAFGDLIGNAAAAAAQGGLDDLSRDLGRGMRMGGGGGAEEARGELLALFDAGADDSAVLAALARRCAAWPRGEAHMLSDLVRAADLDAAALALLRRSPMRYSAAALFRDALLGDEPSETLFEFAVAHRGSFCNWPSVTDFGAWAAQAHLRAEAARAAEQQPQQQQQQQQQQRVMAATRRKREAEAAAARARTCAAERGERLALRLAAEAWSDEMLLPMVHARARVAFVREMHAQQQQQPQQQRFTYSMRAAAETANQEIMAFLADECDTPLEIQSVRYMCSKVGVDPAWSGPETRARVQACLDWMRPVFADTMFSESDRDLMRRAAAAAAAPATTASKAGGNAQEYANVPDAPNARRPRLMRRTPEHAPEHVEHVEHAPERAEHAPERAEHASEHAERAERASERAEHVEHVEVFSPLPAPPRYKKM